MDELDAGLPWPEFCTYLAGLSHQSRWWRAARAEPVLVTGEAASNALRAL